jgi:hypothetical protein
MPNNQTQEIYKSNIYSDMTDERKKLLYKYQKYSKELKKKTGLMGKLNDKCYEYLALNKNLKAERYLKEYKKEVLKTIKLHKEIKEEIIYSRYFLLLAKFKNKQKANIKKKKLLNKLQEAINVSKKEVERASNIIKTL